MSIFHIIMIYKFLFVIQLLSSSFKDSNLDRFIEYTKYYNKNYNNTEFMYRYGIFTRNLEKINRFNINRNNTYNLGINNFTDVTNDEFRRLYLSRKHYYSLGNANNKHDLNKPFFYKQLNIPSSIDWRAKGLVTDVKDQGGCGSCWAFSAVGVIEGQHANNTGKLVSLSEQNLVDCSGDYDNEGCNGGWPEAAMRYVVKNGIDTESKYPYKGIDENCDFNKSYIGAHISKTINITNGSMVDLYKSIGTIGPISIAIDASNNFQFYDSGIYTDYNCSKTELDHAVLAVGYGFLNNTKYIIVKNSWGKDWGMDGYIYMNTNIDNMCGMATDASYALV